MGNHWQQVAAGCLTTLLAIETYADTSGYLDEGPVPNNAHFLTTQPVHYVIPASPSGIQQQPQRSPNQPQAGIAKAAQTPTAVPPQPKPSPLTTSQSTSPLVNLPSIPTNKKSNRSPIVRLNWKIQVAEFIVNYPGFTLFLIFCALILFALALWCYCRVVEIAQFLQTVLRTVINWLSQRFKK